MARQIGISLLEATVSLDGQAHGRMISPAGFPYMGFGSGTKPNPLPTGYTDADWDWFVKYGPRLPMKITGITLLANGASPTGSQDALLIVHLDQNSKYFRDCGNTYPVSTEPATQYQLVSLGIVEYRPGQPRLFQKDFKTPFMLTEDDCLIVNGQGVGGGSVQPAWTLFYEVPDAGW